MKVYYNDNEKTAIAWMRELAKAGHITEGVFDDRSIAEVQPEDLVGFERVHFFAGIAGWEYALRLAGWPQGRECWTGSCPCQPYSAAGKRKGHKDSRDLWPAFFELIKARRPQVIFGEQVASSEVVGTELEAAFIIAVQGGDYAKANKLAKRLAQSSGFHYWTRWVDRIQADMETIGYSLRFKVLGAHSVRAPHIRQRLYWVAYASRQSSERRTGRLSETEAGIGSSREFDGSMSHRSANGCEASGLAYAEHTERRAEYEVNELAPGRDRLGRRGTTSRLADTNGGQSSDGGLQRGGQFGLQPEGDGVGCGLEHAAGNGREQRRAEPIGRSVASGRGDSWDRYELIPCRDGKARRLKSGIEPLVTGLPGRVGLLRGYGNSIVPQTAAAFIQAFLESETT